MPDLTRLDTSPDTRASAGPRRYAAFLSYCHADRVAAEALHRFLETYRLPRDVRAPDADAVAPESRLRPVFVDRTDMPAGTDLRDEINVALAASGSLIVLCSPAAAKSRWVDLEIERFKQHHGESRVFAVIIDGLAHGSESPETADRECFPPALRIRQTPDGAVRADPAAVDLRRSGDGTIIGQLRLVAGLIGVPLDQLVHRDARRRQRRTLVALIGLSLALAGTSALAFYALAARNEAQRQRFAAEGMIEFMIGDLRKTLEPMGRLSAMDPLGKRALDYYREQDSSSLDADSLGRRARVLMLVGEIQDQRGNLDAALGNFQTAATTTRQLLDRTPDDPKRIFDHAQSIYWVGYIAYRRGNIDTAEPAFKEYGRLADQLVVIDPANSVYQAEKGYAYSNLGTMLYTRGRNAEAETALRKSLAMSVNLARGKTADAQEQYDLAISHAWLADVLERQGKLQAAIAERQTERGVLETILAADALNGAAKDALADCKRAQARFALARGDNPLARKLAQEAAREAQLMASTDPSNAEAASAAAVSYLTLGDVLLANGDTSGAENAAAMTRRYSALLLARDRRVPKWRLIEVRELSLRSRVAAMRGMHADALALAEAALSEIAMMPASGRDASDVRWQRNTARLQTGEAQLALGRLDEAAKQFTLLLNDMPIDGEAEEARVAALKARADVGRRRATEA